MDLNEAIKQVQILTQSTGQLKASINKVEGHLSDEEFKDYCDHIYSAVAYQDLISKRIRRGDSPDKENLIMPIDNEFKLPFEKC